MEKRKEMSVLHSFSGEKVTGMVNFRNKIFIATDKSIYIYPATPEEVAKKWMYLSQKIDEIKNDLHPPRPK